MSVPQISAGWRAGATRPGRADAGIVRRAAAVALSVAAFVLLAALYSRIAATVPINSDHASILLEADDVRHGNLLLHGWVLTAITFYTTDLPFYVLGLWLRGFSPALLREVPAALYALVVLCAVALAGRGPDAQRRRHGQIAAFVLLGLPSLTLAETVLVGVNHVGTALFMLLTLLALDTAGDGRRGPARLTLFGLLLALTVFGDSMAVVLLLAPVAAVSAARALKDRTRWPEERAILIPTLAAFLLSRLTFPLIRLAGSFQSGEPTTKLTYLETLPQNALVTVRSLLGLYRANFFGTDAGLGTAGFLVGLLGLGFVLYSLRLGLRAWHRWEIGGDRISEILAAAMALNLIAYLLDFDVVKYLNTLYSPPERYLVPFFVFGAVLAGRLGVGRVVAPHLRLGLSALALAYTGLFGQQLLAPPIDLPAAHLARWLGARGLSYGYGNFWCSNLTTALSGGRVTVRAVSADGRPGLGQMFWFSKRDWYQGTPAHFLVYEPSHFEGQTFYWKGVDPDSARRTFGPPDETAKVDDYTVLIWRGDITPRLLAGGGT